MRSVTGLMLLLLAGLALGQPAPITPEMPVDSAVLRQWLHSGDARLIAWSADFARRRNDAAVLAEMPELLGQWAESPIDRGGESQGARQQAQLAVLDALIQTDTPVPVGAVRQLATGFAAQAAILAARLPLSDARGMLGEWTYGRMGGWNGPTLARIAAMLLAKEPEPSLVARIVADSEEELRVSVVPAGTGVGEGGGSGSCGDGMGSGSTSGWPQLYSYDLVEGDDPQASLTVVDLDGDRIALQRFQANGGHGSCFGVRPLNPVTRHKLLAHWLGVPDRGMTWQTRESVMIHWTNQAAFEQELGAAVWAHRERLRRTVVAMRERGLLREGDEAEPRLVVRTRCEIKPCPLSGGQ